MAQWGIWSAHLLSAMLSYFMSHENASFCCSIYRKFSMLKIWSVAITMRNELQESLGLVLDIFLVKLHFMFLQYIRQAQQFRFGRLCWSTKTRKCLFDYVNNIISYVLLALLFLENATCSFKSVPSPLVIAFG